MSSGYVRAGANANRRHERTFPSSGNSLHPIAKAMQALRSLWPSKTAIEIASRAQSDERTCKHWLAGNYDPNANALVNLLRSDAGPALLDALMCDPVPSWYERQRRILRIAEREAEASAAREEIKNLRREIARN